MAGPVVCTVASNSHLAFARVLAHSFLEHHPRGKVYLLLVDNPHPSIDYDSEPFSVVFVKDIGLPRLESMAFRYTVVELSNALKPFLMEYLHQKTGCKALCYLDTDILVTGKLSEVFRLLRRADLVLTPHITAPLQGEQTPNDRSILLSGCYNLGFLGVSFTPPTRRFLQWWQQRLSQECLLDVEQGLMYDQRWMDLAPSFVPKATILHDPGYNMAYWNLAERRLERRRGRWWVGDAELRFFHFSGLDLDDVESISRFQDRYRLSDRSDLQELFSLYRELVAAQGLAEPRRLPYGFGHFDNGVPIPVDARRALQRVDPLGERWPDPFASGSEQSFSRWLAEPIAAHPVPVPRVALEAWRQRTDLQQRFPDPAGADLLAFATWLVERGEREWHFPEEMIAPTRDALAARQYRRFDNGVPFPSLARRVLERIDPLGRRWPDPTSTAEKDSFYRWLVEPVDPEHPLHLPRIALLVWEERDDLQESCPEPRVRDRQQLAEWLVENGQADCELAVELLKPIREALSARRFRVFDNGVSFPPVALRALQRIDLTGRCWPDPTETVGSSFYSWLNEAVADHPVHLPRLALLIWQERTDLQLRYPDPTGAGLERFAGWYVESAGSAYSLAPELVEPTERTLAARRFTAFDDGTPCPQVARQALRMADPQGKRWPDARVSTGDDTFFAWLLEPDDTEHPLAIPRLALMEWRERDDLRQRFPEPQGSDRFRFAEWLLFAGGELQGFAQHLQPLRRAFARLQPQQLDNGKPVSQAARHALQEHNPRGERWPDPRVTTGEDTFLLWLLEPDDPEHPLGLPQLALLEWQEREDLRRLFPEPQGRDRYRFVAWLLEHGEEQVLLPGECLQQLQQAYATLQPVCFDNGVQIWEVARHALQEANARGERWPDPRVTTGDDTFLQWLQEPDDSAFLVPLPRLALLEWQAREDLQESYPEAAGRDRHRFAEWLIESGAEQIDLGEEPLRQLQEALAVALPPCFDNGRPLPRLALQLLRECNFRGERWPDPRATGGEGSFLQWLQGSDSPEHPIPIPRLALLLWEARDDLRECYPEPQGQDRYRFAEWLLDNQSSDEHVKDLLSVEDLLLPTQQALEKRLPRQLDNGVRLAPLARQALEDLDPLGTRWPDPADTAGEGSFFSWLLEPVATTSEGICLNRMAILLWEARADLRKAFPEPTAEDGLRYAHWFVAQAADQGEIAEVFIAPLASKLRKLESAACT